MGGSALRDYHPGMTRLRQVHVRYVTLREAAEPLVDPWLRLPSVARPEWRPACDVLESGVEWIVRVELAGVEPDELEVVLYEDGLVIAGRRPWTSTPDVTELRVHAAEIRHGPFRLALRLPGPVDREAAAVAYERGMLLVRLPKGTTA